MIQIPFMFTPDYFISAIQPIYMDTGKKTELQFVFPPVSVAPKDVKKQLPQPQMFHAGNKTHDAMFVCFYVLLNGVMKYHQNTRSWNILERQHKILFAEKLRTDENRVLLNQVFNKVFVGKIDDELTNTNTPTISIKTFAAICYMSSVSVMVIDDNLYSMTIIQPHGTAFPKHALHIKDGSVYIMWDECSVSKYDDCQYVNTTNLGFTAQLIDQVVEKEMTKIKANQTNAKKIASGNLLKAIGSYRMEELQVMCVELNIGYMDIPFTGKKVLKKDIYDYIKTKKP